MSAVHVVKLRKEFTRRKRPPVVALDDVSFAMARGECVAVTYGMQHGGPFPATTSPPHTSVGMTAVRRFTRPIAFQNAPADALPPELREDNPLGIRRRVDGIPR